MKQLIACSGSVLDLMLGFNGYQSDAGGLAPEPTVVPRRKGSGTQKL